MYGAKETSTLQHCKRKGTTVPMHTITSTPQAQKWSASYTSHITTWERATGIHRTGGLFVNKSTV